MAPPPTAPQNPEERFIEAVTAVPPCPQRVRRLIQKAPSARAAAWSVRWAAWQGDAPEVARCIEAGTCPPSDLDQALLWGLQRRHAPVVAQLLPVTSRDVVQKALYGAIEAGPSSAWALALLIPWADPAADQCRALCMAADHGNLEAVRQLLPVSDARALNSHALKSAAEGGHADIVALLIPKSDPHNHSSHALRLAAWRGHAAVVAQLVPVSNLPLAWNILKDNREWASLDFLVPWARPEWLSTALRGAPAEAMPHARAQLQALLLADTVSPMTQSQPTRPRI